MEVKSFPGWSKKKNSAGKDGAQGIWQINRKGGRQQKEENKEKKKFKQKARSFPPRPDNTNPDKCFHPQTK